jgi:hypothetical protein
MEERYRLRSHDRPEAVAMGLHRGQWNERCRWIARILHLQTVTRRHVVKPPAPPPPPPAAAAKAAAAAATAAAAAVAEAGHGETSVHANSTATRSSSSGQPSPIETPRRHHRVCRRRARCGRAHRRDDGKSLAAAGGDLLALQHLEARADARRRADNHRVELLPARGCRGERAAERA